jgi:hypothetical protein
LYLLSLGNFSTVYYSLVRLPLESSFALGSEVMESHLFFFPNSSFYGPKDNLTAFYLNHAVWLVAIFFGAFRVITPFLTAQKRKGMVASELLLGLLFVLSCYLYIDFYPLKHTQYLIPISVFIAYYCADFFRQLFSGKTTALKLILSVTACLIGGYLLVISTIHVNAQKKILNNQQQIRETNQLLQLIPKDQKIFDLEGRTVFWKPAYYICCLPFGSYVYNLSQQPEPVRTVLEREAIQYIFQGYSGRINVFPAEDYAYIYKNYEAVPGWDYQLFKRRTTPLSP